MRVAVTGASGFVGGAVSRALARAGHAVLTYGGRPAAALTQPLPSYKTWDVTAGSIHVPPVDAVIHCAAHVDYWGPDALFDAVNVAGTRTVLDVFAGAPRFIHMSSASVYHPGQRRVLREDAPVGTGQLSAYARSKAAAERVVLASGRAAVVLRPHLVYGPGDTTLMPRVLAARRLGWLPVPGTGRNRVSITHVENLALAVRRALEGPVTNGIFNVGDAEGVVMDDLLRTMLRRHGVPDRIVYIPRPLAWSIAILGERARAGGSRPPLLTRYIVSHIADDLTLDLTAARTVLGYVPRWSYRDQPETKAAA